MLDITKDIVLPKKWQRRYALLRITTWIVFLILAIYAGHQILFPPRVLNFNVNPLRLNRNTMTEPILTSGVPFERGKVPAGNTMQFSGDAIGEYSDIIVTISTDAKSKTIANDSIAVRKSYQAYLFPTGRPLGFKDGSLVTTNNEYFIISNGKKRKFASQEIIQKLGYQKNAFQAVTEADLKNNDEGDVITQATYPDNALFKIDSNYYELMQGKLMMFVSEKAFMSQFDARHAIEKDRQFLEQLPFDENSFLGFADGTLLSSPLSIFITSGNYVYPINEPATFLALGYRWEDVIQADTDEVGMYQEQKVFTIDQPNPDGTLFQEKETGKIFLIRNREKHELPSLNVAKSYSKIDPILVDAKSLTETASCKLSKNFLSLNSFSCAIPIATLESLIGNNYQFALSPMKDMQIDRINVTFTKKLELLNAKQSLADIKNQIIQRYSQQ